MKIANIISWSILAVALIGAGWYWWSRRNPTGYYGNASSSYKLGRLDHLNLIMPNRYKPYKDGWDGEITVNYNTTPKDNRTILEILQGKPAPVALPGNKVKKVDFFFERLENKIMPILKSMGIPSSMLNDEYFKHYVFGFYKGANIEMNGMETGDPAFIAALYNYLKSDKVAYSESLVTVGQFIDNAVLDNLSADVADGFIQVENLGADQGSGLADWGYTGLAPVNYNVKPDGTLCPPGFGWCSNGNMCVPIANKSINVRDGQVGFFNVNSSNQVWAPCTNWQSGGTA